MAVWHARNEADTEDRMKYSRDNLHCHFVQKRKIPRGMKPGMQSEEQGIKGRAKDTAQRMLRRNYCRENWDSAFPRNVDTHEPGCLVFICDDLFLIFHDAVSSYRT